MDYKFRGLTESEKRNIHGKTASMVYHMVVCLPRVREADDPNTSQIKAKTVKMAFPPSTRHFEVRAKTGQPGVRIVCPVKVNRLLVVCHLVS